MSDSGVGFGGFLLGVGGGYYLFRQIDFTFDIISYLLILMGVGIILGSFLSKGGKNPISDVFGGFIGGLFLAAFLTQGFGIIGDFTNQWDDFGDSVYRETMDVTLDVPIVSDTVSFSVDNVNGAIEVNPWNGDDLKIELEIRAKGSSTAEAEENLADFRYDLSDSTSGGTQELELTFPMPSPTLWSTYSVSIQVFVPDTGLDELYVDTTNGAITLGGLEIADITLDSTNGAISFSDVVSSDISVHTTNGGISGTIAADEGNFATTNGAIELTVEPESGSYNLDTTNGSIDLNLPTGDDIGFNINLDTSVGGIDVNLPNIVYSIDRSREKVGETIGYDTKTVQIEIDADTTIGGIELN